METPPYLRIKPVTRSEFAAAYAAARTVRADIAEACSPEPTGAVASFYLSLDDQSGYAIAEETGELTNLFSTIRGRGDSLVRSALRNGAAHLDCFDGYLPAFYARHGFAEYKRAANWNPNGPDVVYMVHADAYPADRAAIGAPERI